MTRLALILLLSGCVPDGYVVRSVSVDAAPGRVGFTVTLDNLYEPQTCIDLCVVE